MVEDLDKCIHLLRKNDIKLVVFDMDFTAVAQHSRGRLPRLALNDYIRKATPAFLALVPKLFQENFSLAIATHSDEAEYGGQIQPETHILGKELATQLIKKSFPPEISDAFFIVAYNPRVHPEDETEANRIKRYHMRTIREKFKVQLNEIVFFDDTASVISDCQDACGVIHSIKVDPDYGFQIEDVLRNFN